LVLIKNRKHNGWTSANEIKTQTVQNKSIPPVEKEGPEILRVLPLDLPRELIFYIRVQLSNVS